MLFDVGDGRCDPLWSGLWSPDARGVTWASRRRLDAQLRSGVLSRAPRHLLTDPDIARARLAHSWDAKVAVLGALNSWRTLTGEQLAHMTGLDVRSRAVRQVISDLFALGAINVGELAAPGKVMAPPFYRLGDVNVVRKVFASQMSYPELIAATGSGLFRSGAADRHDVLTAELALRVASWTEGVGTVLGEAHSRASDLVFHGPGLPLPVGFPDRPADMTLVRDDGLRVVVEMTTSRTPGLAAKLAAWARALELHPLEKTGVVVVVLVAPDIGGRSDAGHVRKAISRAVRMRPGTRGNSASSRLLFTQWDEWFPESGKASPGFYSLAAHRLVGDDWSPVQVMDRALFPAPAGLRDPLAVVANASGMHQTPMSLRLPEAARPQVADVLLARAGVAAPSLHVPGLGAVNLPRRMRF